MTCSYLKNVPEFPAQKNVRKTKLMKGRPITAEEFDRIIDAVDVLPERQRESVRLLLLGLWWSGLRLGEALSLTWDRWADGIRVDTSGEFVVLLISAEDEKGGKDREYPIAPEFEEFLLSVPKSERDGYVFDTLLYRGVSRRRDSVSKVLVKIGEAAGVKVDETLKRTGKGGRRKATPVYASAHDCRRAFGNRWARRVKPMVLRELMRHASVTTTEKYYIGLEAQETARHLRNVMQADSAGPFPGKKGELPGELTNKGVSGINRKPLKS
jgi:integrase